MKRVISFFLCAIMLMSSAHTVLATEIIKVLVIQFHMVLLLFTMTVQK